MKKQIALFALSAAAALAAARGSAWITTKEGENIRGILAEKSVRVTVNGAPREIPLKNILSIHAGSEASAGEAKRISEGLAAMAGTDRKRRDGASADLTDIGIPAITPLLKSYKDTDGHEPLAHYRLFERLIPGYADAADRGADLIRLTGGEALRGKVETSQWTLTLTDGMKRTVPSASLRRLAMFRSVIDRTFEVHSLRHATQIEYLDTGIAVDSASRLDIAAKGFVRLSFDIDGWASDPDGIRVPGPNYKTNLVDGHPFGALVGKTGPGGSVWLSGSHLVKQGIGDGRLFLAVNDNRHWQNNIGSFQVRLKVNGGFDLGDAR